MLSDAGFVIWLHCESLLLGSIFVSALFLYCFTWNSAPPNVVLPLNESFVDFFTNLTLYELIGGLVSVIKIHAFSEPDLYATFIFQPSWIRYVIPSISLLFKYIPSADNSSPVAVLRNAT